MKKTYLYQPKAAEGLDMFEDARGIIADVFYKSQIDHVAILRSVAGAIRGNHYHKETIQHTLLMTGSMRYWSQPVDQSIPPYYETLVPGDMVTSMPNEIHALEFLEDSDCVVFTTGTRGGIDYEKDNHRVDSIVGEVNE